MCQLFHFLIACAKLTDERAGGRAKGRYPSDQTALSLLFLQKEKKSSTGGWNWNRVRLVKDCSNLVSLILRVSCLRRPFCYTALEQITTKFGIVVSLSLSLVFSSLISTTAESFTTKFGLSTLQIFGWRKGRRWRWNSSKRATLSAPGVSLFFLRGSCSYTCFMPVMPGQQHVRRRERGAWEEVQTTSWTRISSL